MHMKLKNDGVCTGVIFKDCKTLKKYFQYLKMKASDSEKKCCSRH